MAPMAKKKNLSKKHKFKHVEPTSIQAEAQAKVSSTSGASLRTEQVAATAGATARDFSYVLGDLNRIAFYAGILIALELILWYLFGHTGLGTAIYRLVQV
jgi:hypothetical protein